MREASGGAGGASSRGLAAAPTGSCLRHRRVERGGELELEEARGRRGGDRSRSPRSPAPTLERGRGRWARSRVAPPPWAAGRTRGVGRRSAPGSTARSRAPRGGRWEAEAAPRERLDGAVAARGRRSDVAAPPRRAFAGGRGAVTATRAWRVARDPRPTAPRPSAPQAPDPRAAECSTRWAFEGEAVTAASSCERGEVGRTSEVAGAQVPDAKSATPTTNRATASPRFRESRVRASVAGQHRRASVPAVCPSPTLRTESASAIVERFASPLIGARASRTSECSRSARR